MSNKSMNRRSFLKTSACSATIGISGCKLTGKTTTTTQSVRRKFGANERIALGIVGMGVRGKNFVISTSQLAKQKLSNVELVAVCDVWRIGREQAVALVEKESGSKPQAFNRHQDMLEKGGVDAVIITTPDFWHVPVLLDCLKAGKDAYVEKPLGVTLSEARKARDAVHATGRVVQVGTQRRSENKFHAARDFVKTGRLGKISTVEGAFNDCSPRWRREEMCKKLKENDIDWKYYLRDRAYRPFNPRHVLEWKLFRDFTMGTSGLLGCHLYDSLQLVMDVPYPASAVSQGGVYVYKDGREVEDTFMSLIEYPREFILHYTTRLGNWSSPGLKIFGTQGTFDVEKTIFTEEGGKAKRKPPFEEQKLTVKPNQAHQHLRNFLDCMRTRKTPVASIDIGYQHMITSVIAQEAMYAGRRLRYDPKKDRIV
ncbi:MAG: Gfo/Idh/MocA family protein [Planctomycetota bacterium]|jgi:predicted dehydrogenase